MKITTLILYFILLFLFLFYSPNFTSANFVKYSKNPILTIGSLGEWDEKLVETPSVIWSNSIGFLWYSGQNNIPKRAIGYASLSFNISGDINVEKYINNPIINPSFINQNDVGIDEPSVLLEENNNSPIYKMWFKNTFGPGNHSFRLHYSTSQNGKNWETPTQLNLQLPTSVDSAVAPSVLFRNDISKYQMWFGGRNNFDFWSIIYAESKDGINWTNVTRALEPEVSWEGRNINGPSVIYKNNIYFMFYDGDKNIYYATSSDGIHWFKSKSSPVLKPDSLSIFENLRLVSPFILEKNNKYYLFYTGVNSIHNEIGLAISSELPPIIFPPDSLTPTPTLTITPTVTLTLTPTITPTSSPTPTPTITPTPPFYPIILIPGLGASWNSKALNSCVLTNSDPWKMTPYVSVYKRLINTLTRNAGFKLNSQFYVYNYDWRQDLPIQAQNFKKFIDDISQTAPLNTKFHIVGHSLGGLVIRSYLEDFAGENKIADVITVGSPHEGTVIAYPLWENGEIWSSDLPAKIALNTILSRCRLILSKSKITKLPKLSTKKEILQKVVPSVKSLLPVFDFLTAGKSVIAWNSMTEQNSWLKSHPWPVDLYSLNFYSLSGKNQQTLSYLDVISPSQSDAVKKNWIDGLPVQKYYSSSGDGTVLNTSSSIKGAENFIMPGNHLEIIAQEAGIKKILEWLELGSVKVAAQIETPEIRARNTLTFSLDSKVSMRLTDLRLNRIVAENDEFLTFYNPVRGSYLLKLAPSQTGKNTLVSSVLSETSEEINLETEVDFKNLKPRTFTVIYSQAPKPDLRIISRL